MIRAKRFLQLIALLHIAGGLLLPWLANTVVAAPYLDHLNATFHVTLNGGSREQTRFMLGLFGPTVASWGVLFFFVVSSAFEQPSRRAWWAMVLACLVWAPYDSLLSVMHGVYWNVVPDAIVLSALLMPLLWVRKNFGIGRRV